jgi:hypothetical protein
MKKSFTTLIALLDKYQNTLPRLSAFFILIGGLGYSLYLGNTLIFPDPHDYLNIATNIAAGKGFSLDGTSPTALFPPAYPVFLALFVKLGAPIIFLRYLNFIALALCVYVIRSILSCSKAGSGAGLSAILLLGYGVLFYTAGTLYTQTLFMLVLLLLIRVTIIKDFGYLHAVLLGILSAILIMIHTTGVFIPPVLVLWQLLPNHYNKIGKAALSALVAILCIVPWTYRNYTAFDMFIPFTSHGGDTLYIGNNPHTALDEWYTYIDEDYYKEAALVPEREQNSYYLHKTFAFWTEHPGDAGKLYLRKLADYFNYRNELSTSKEESSLKDVIMFVTYYPLLFCLVLRLLFAFTVPLSRTEKLLVAIYLISALFHALFLPRIRFRLPYDAVLIAHVGIMFTLVKNRLISA